MKAKAKAKAGKDSTSARLTRDDWLDAAYNAVLEGGLANVRVLVLADVLGVTRGSFYWHFADHAELLNALIDRWWRREQELRQRLVADSSLDPRADLERVLEAALENPGAELQNLRFEQALRDVGRHDEEIAKKLHQLDKMRTNLFEAKLRRLIDDPSKAGDLATLFYIAAIGSIQALSQSTTSPKRRPYFMNLILNYLVDANIPVKSVGGKTPRGRKPVL